MLIPTLPDGLRLDISHPGLSRRDRAMIALGRAERPELRMVRRYTPSHRDIVDAGASVGIVGSRAARRLAPGQQYVGIEMVPWAARLAEENVRRHARPNVTVVVINAAICSHLPRVGTYYPGSLASAGAMPGDEIATTTLSRVLNEHSVRDGYTLLMDIEGSESDILVNDGSGLKRAGMIVVELHDAGPTRVNPWGCSVGESLARLRAIGFVVRDEMPPVYYLERS